MSYKFSVLRKRCKAIHSSHKQRAAKARAELGYSSEDLSRTILAALGLPCKYCFQLITAENFSVDHEQPISRAGTHTLDNLDICCLKCNQVKGALTTDEFLTLLSCLKGLSEFARKNILARLRAGWHGR